MQPNMWINKYLKKNISPVLKHKFKEISKTIPLSVLLPEQDKITKVNMEKLMFENSQNNFEN